MNKRENFLSLLRRKGYEEAPVGFSLCPSLVEEYKKQTGSELHYEDYFEMPSRNISDMKLPNNDIQKFSKYYDYELKPGTHIDHWGVAHEPGSQAAKHMTYMRNPLRSAEDVEDIMNYPFPDYENASGAHQKGEVDLIHARGLAAVGGMQMTIWETAWYIRSMEELMMDMMTEDPKADILLDKITELAIIRAESFARAGVDIIFLGDDIGMQRTPLMSIELYTNYLKPRLKKVIDAAKAINPQVIIFYHSCGYATPFIPDLIEAGIDVLNPVQPECMDFKDVYEMYGDKVSFHGTIGTQTTMPFGTPEEVRKEVFKNLEIVGSKGGLYITPTHLLEPEVPWENIMAYVNACRDFGK